MRHFLVALAFFGLVSGVLPVRAATVTCEVKSVQGSTIVLENCDAQRAKGFEPGSKVKIKLQKESDK